MLLRDRNYGQFSGHDIKHFINHWRESASIDSAQEEGKIDANNFWIKFIKNLLRNPAPNKLSCGASKLDNKFVERGVGCGFF
ncbi:MAG TPA: hypothetical protein DDW51_10110, partial [Cyanobacteria bacterium UBA11367]|nr:hypothetical protein [Cyanobacteria bacterium UBA11367]